MLTFRYEGLRELAQSLRDVNAGLYETLLSGLGKVGEVIRAEGARQFLEYGAGEDREPTFVKGAEGLGVLVRPNTSKMAIVSVAQTKRRSQDMGARRSNFGDLMMRHGLIPALGEKIGDAYEIVDVEVADLLRRNGF